MWCVCRAAEVLGKNQEGRGKRPTNTQLDTTIDDTCCLNLSIFVCEGLRCHLCLSCASLVTNHRRWSCLRRSSNPREEQRDNTHRPSLARDDKPKPPNSALLMLCGMNERTVATHGRHASTFVHKNTMPPTKLVCRWACSTGPQFVTIQRLTFLRKIRRSGEHHSNRNRYNNLCSQQWRRKKKYRNFLDVSYSSGPGLYIHIIIRQVVAFSLPYEQMHDMPTIIDDSLHLRRKLGKQMPNTQV